jgi:hypothetical protein
MKYKRGDLVVFQKNLLSGVPWRHPIGTFFKIGSISILSLDDTKLGTGIVYPNDGSSGFWEKEVTPATKIVARFYGKVL